jgi:uncharacterized membrane protein YjjB (DUF3815 family)
MVGPDAIRAKPLERPWPILLAAYALAGAALTPVLGGGWREAVAGGLVGLVVGVVGGVAGSALRRSSLVFIVPGVLMLVPGSAGFTSALQLLANQTVSGITAGFDTFVTAMSIAYGLMIASVILPRRFASIQPTRVGGAAARESAS